MSSGIRLELSAGMILMLAKILYNSLILKVEDIEKRIKARFSGIPAVPDGAKREVYTIPDNDEPIVGFNTELLQPRRETLEMVVRDLYPRGGHVEQATFWTGLRPMTPDGTPVVGRTRFKNLWLNTGHGTLGWTMACGSGQLLSDLLSGRTPAIPYEDLSVARYSRGFTPSRPGHLHGAHS